MENSFRYTPFIVAGTMLVVSKHQRVYNAYQTEIEHYPSAWSMDHAVLLPLGHIVEHVDNVFVVFKTFDKCIYVLLIFGTQFTHRYRNALEFE